MRDPSDQFFMHAALRHRRGFSLVELVIVVVILGIIGAIAIPRMSRASKEAGPAVLAQDLAIIHRAIEQYKAEHAGELPGSGAHLIGYTDSAGNTNATKTYPYIYGPYLLELPTLPVGSEKGKASMTAGGNPGDNPGVGWWMNATTGRIRANLATSEVDPRGRPFNDY